MYILDYFSFLSSLSNDQANEDDLRIDSFYMGKKLLFSLNYSRYTSWALPSTQRYYYVDDTDLVFKCRIINLLVRKHIFPI